MVVLVFRTRTALSRSAYSADKIKTYPMRCATSHGLEPSDSSSDQPLRKCQRCESRQLRGYVGICAGLIRSELRMVCCIFALVAGRIINCFFLNLRISAPLQLAVEHSSVEVARESLKAGPASARHSDGSYRLERELQYLIADLKKPQSCKTIAFGIRSVFKGLGNKSAAKHLY